MTGEIIAFPDDEISATRRRFLSGGAAAVAAPIVRVTIPAGEGPTDPVIVLIAEEYRWRSMACAARAKADKAWFAIRSGPGSLPPLGLYAETDRLQKLADDLFDRIMVTPAETLAGTGLVASIAPSGDRISRGQPRHHVMRDRPGPIRLN
jgi:hypothetical protein